jgi:hypothetical protein
MADVDDTGEMSYPTLIKVMSQVGCPQLDEELSDFLLYLVYRQSESLKKLNYVALIEIFDDEYLVEASPHEDEDKVNLSQGETEDEKEEQE